jgi:callose synthase
MKVMIIFHISPKNSLVGGAHLSFFLLQTVSVGRRRFSAEFQLVFRLIKGLIFITFISVVVILIAIPGMTVLDIFVCILAFMPTGWGLLLV